MNKELIKELRQTYNWSQEILAGVLGIDRATLANYETDRTPPPSEINTKLVWLQKGHARYILKTQ